jgi:hypothetical protein
MTRVGGKVTNIKGKGTVKLLASCDGKTCILMLNDVLHVPGQPHNLISLGRWDKASGNYSGGHGLITLNTKDEKQSPKVIKSIIIYTRWMFDYTRQILCVRMQILCLEPSWVHNPP